MDHNKTTVEDYLKFFGENTSARPLRWQMAADHDERIKILEEALDECYRRLVDGRKLYAEADEVLLSKHIADMLSMGGIQATNEQDINGHCDIVIKCENGFMWLGEAKIHTSYDWLIDGFDQLSTRYGTAMAGRDHGELIIYLRGKSALDVLKRWKDTLLEKNTEVAITQDIEQVNLHFRTRHRCQNSGHYFHVRHTIVPMWHNPKK